MSHNMPLFWKIQSYFNGLYQYNFQKFVWYFNTIFYVVFNFKNPFYSIKKIKSHIYPYQLIKKNQTILEINDKKDLSMVLKKLDNIVHFEDNLMIINFNKKQLKFKYYDDIELDIFYQNIYSKLPVKNKIVIDIGGYVGDSALLYRALGSKKVIMLEPHPKFSEFALENIALNDESSNIEVVNAGLSNMRGNFKISYKNSADPLYFSENQQNDMKIPQITLEDILCKYTDCNFVLKMDCEGCEYDVLLNSSEETLKKFDTILVEFHSGFLNICEKLKFLGFNIKILNCKYTPKKKHRGHLIAFR